MVSDTIFHSSGPKYIEDLLTSTNCFITLDDLMKEFADSGLNFDSSEGLAEAVVKYFCDLRLFNRYYHQGEQIPVYELIEVGTEEVVAYAMPVDANKMIFGNVQGDMLKRGGGYLHRNRLDLKIAEEAILVLLKRNYDN
ncbi:hypothetical protein CL619_04930 [archaeon]|nr:hypothetical protein [archaeon]|tara:strand:+ start:1398 stop:1814 length:417 start_codon:yes stop_codon:yes gene_type:complete